MSLKDIIKEWCDNNMQIHNDWTGTRVETINNYTSVNDFVNDLSDYISENIMKVIHNI